MFQQISKLVQMTSKKKRKKKPRNKTLKNLLSQMVAGSAACATTTTSRDEPNASDARKCATWRIMKESQNTLDRWRTKKLRPSLPDKMVKINQDQSSISSLTTGWLRSTVWTNKRVWVTGPVRDALTITTLSESNATCVTFLTLKVIECCTHKLNRDFSWVNNNKLLNNSSTNNSSSSQWWCKEVVNKCNRWLLRCNSKWCMPSSSNKCSIRMLCKCNSNSRWANKCKENNKSNVLKTVATTWCSNRLVHRCLLHSQCRCNPIETSYRNK